MTITDDSIKEALEAEAMEYAAEDEPFYTGQVVAITAGHATHDIYTAFLPPLLPLFIANMGLSRTEAGLLTVCTQAPSLVQPVIGHMADHTSRHRFVFLAPAVTAILMSFLGYAPSYILLAALLVLVGLSSAAFHAVAPVIAGKLSGRSLGKGMSFWMVGGEAGRVLGPIIIVTALRFTTLRGIPWLMPLGLAVSFWLVIRMRNVRTHTHEDRPKLHWRESLAKMRSLIIPLAGFILMRSFLMAAMGIYLPTFLTEEGASLWFAGASLTIFEAAGVAGALTGGSISDRMGRRIVLFILSFTAPLLMFGFLSFGGWPRFPLLMMLGFCLLGTTPVIMALVQESFPENRAMANGVYMMLSFVIRSGGILVVGVLGDLFGLRIASFISAVGMFLCLPFIIFLPKGRKRQK